MSHPALPVPVPPLPVPHDTPALSDVDLAVAGYLARYAGHTRARYETDLRIWLRWLTERQLHPWSVKRPHVELYVRWLDETRGLKPATVSARIGTVVGWYRLCVLDGYLERSPAEYVRRPPVPPDSPRLGLDRMELGAFIQHARALSPRHAALASLLGLLGLRVSEACHVQIEDLGHERGHRTLHVIGKGGKGATLPLAPPVARAIDACAGERTSGPLLLTEVGTPLNRAAATRMVRRIAKRAGISHPVCNHDLRHGYITAALDAGVPLRDVQIAARHADPRTTTRYDRARHNLDRHAAYIVSAFVAGAA